jgi:hypothetical protein
LHAFRAAQSVPPIQQRQMSDRRSLLRLLLQKESNDTCFCRRLPSPVFPAGGPQEACEGMYVVHSMVGTLKFETKGPCDGTDWLSPVRRSLWESKTGLPGVSPQGSLSYPVPISLAYALRLLHRGHYLIRTLVAYRSYLRMRARILICVHL